MTQTAPAVEVTEQDFDKAFGEAATAAEKTTQAAPAAVTEEPKQTSAEAPKTDAEAEAVAAEEAAKQKAADEAAEAERKAAEEKAALEAMTPEERTAKETADKAAAEAKKTAEEAAARLTKQAEDAEAARKAAEAAAAAKKAAEETPEQKAAREALEATLAPYQPSEEEAKALEAFKKEWPEQAAAIEAKLKDVDRATNKKVFDAVQTAMKQFQERLAPVEQATIEQAQAAHLKAIRDAHADFDEVVPKLPEWIKTQPAMLQPVLQHAYEQGSTQQVLDLLVMYKSSTGTKPVTAGETPEQIAAREAAEAARKKAAEEAAALTPVKSSRTVAAPKGSVDVNDFDGAFKEAAAALK